jgi:hypothetical protein
VHATLQPLHTTADVSDQLKETDTTIGTTQEQQIEFLEVAPEEACLLPSPTKVDISYAETIRSFLTRPYPLYAGAWSGDFVTNTYLIPQFNTINPLLDYLTIPFIQGKIQGFHFLRCGLRFELRMNGTRFHYGQAVMAFQPLDAVYKNYSAAQTTANALTMFPSVIVDPGPSQIGVLEVPYAYPLHFINLTERDPWLGLGSLHLKVLAPLRAVSQTTVPLVEWTLFVSLTDVVLNAFTAKDASVIPARQIQQQSRDSALRFVPENMNFLATDINDVSVQGGMEGSNSVAKQENVIGLNRKDMLFKTIYTKPNLINNSVWTSAIVPTAPVLILPVSPMQNNGTRHYLQHLAEINSFWRGSLRYHIRVVASGFHSGRLTIGWEPSSPFPTGSSLVFLTNRMSMTVDLQQTTDIFFTIPYMSERPWLNTLAGTPNTSKTTNGTIIASVMNPLATPSGEPTDVNIIVWMYGSDDLEFAVPSVRRIGSATPFPAALIQEQCASMELNDDRFGNITGSFSVPSRMTIGESISSVSDLIQKMAPFQAHAVGGTTGPWNRSVSFYEMSNADTCHMTYLARMFVGARGAVRYATVVYNTSSATSPEPTTMKDQFTVGPIVTAVQITGSATFQDLGSLVVRPETPNSIVSVPFYTNTIFWPTQPNSDVGLKPSIVASFRGSSGAYRYYIGAGNDFMFGYLIPPD